VGSHTPKSSASSYILNSDRQIGELQIKKGPGRIRKEETEKEGIKETEVSQKALIEEEADVVIPRRVKNEINPPGHQGKE